MFRELQRRSLPAERAYFHKTRLRSILNPGFWWFFLVETIVVVRELGFFGGLTGLKYWINVSLGAWSLIPLFQRAGYTIVLAETHHSGFCALVLKRRFSFVLYVDLHGIVEELKQVYPDFYPFALAMEKKILTQSDGGSCVGFAQRRFFAEMHRITMDHFHVCPCGTDPQPGRASHQLPFKVVYAGSFAYYERVMDFIEAARANTDPEIQFYLFGGGENEAEIMQYIQKHGIKIEWGGYRPRAEILAFFQTVQVGVSPGTKDVVRKTSSPIKVFDYAICGLPVVTVDIGEWSDLVTEYEAGVVCAESDSQQFLEAIRGLKDPFRWQEAADNALRMATEARLWGTTLAPICQDLQKRLNK